MVNKKELDILVVLFFSVLLSSVLVFGYSQVVDTINKTNSTSMLEDVSTVINLTLLNNTVFVGIDNISEINVSLFGNFNFTTGSNYSGNFTAGAANVNFTGENVNFLTWRNKSGIQDNATNNSHFAFNLTDASGPGIYNITVTFVNTSGNAGFHLVHNISITVNDTTAPNVSSVSTFASNTNHSGTINFNFTLRDNQGDNDNALGGKDYTGVDTVNFTLFNLSARDDFNESTPQNTSTAGHFNITINTSEYSDGIYNITIYANDTSGNENSTNITGVRFDNTAPSATYSCTPNPANNGDVVTCTCTVSDDGGSGVNDPQTSFTSSPSTSSNGNQTLTCTYEDHSGNTGSTTLEFEVKIPSGGGSSGGGGGGSSTFSYTSTIANNVKEFKEIGSVTQSLKVKQRMSLKIAGETHYVGVRDVMVTSARIEINSDPVIVLLDIGEEAKVDVNNDNVYDVYVKLNGITNGKADLTISYIMEEVPEVEIDDGVETSGEIVEEEEVVSDDSTLAGNVWVWVVLVIVVLAIVFWAVTNKGKNSTSSRDKKK